MPLVLLVHQEQREYKVLVERLVIKGFPGNLELLVLQDQVDKVDSKVRKVSKGRQVPQDHREGKVRATRTT